MNVGEQNYPVDPMAQEMLEVTSAIRAVQARAEALAAHFDDTTVGERVTTASTHLGVAATALAAATQEYAPGMQSGVPTFRGEIVLVSAAGTTESGLSLADELVSALLPPEVDDRLLTSSQFVFTLTVANRDRSHVGAAMGHRGPRDLRDIYMLGRAGLRDLGFGDLTIGRIDEYLQNGRPILPPLPEEGDITWAALLYKTLEEVPARVALGSLCDKVLSAGGMGVDAALDSLRGRLEYHDLFMRTEEDRTNVDRAIEILDSFVGQYTATKHVLRASFSDFRR